MNLQLSLPDPELFATRLSEWFITAMRPLPWRKTYDPYSVWISEIMLQQTQMERGVRYFNSWMRRFPDIKSVADATEEDVLASWEGLGYYSRARNLHAAAKCIVAEHGGVFPREVEAIRHLPGIGDYTAGAIAAIAFNIPEPAVDANVLRIFSRICDIDKPVTEKEVRKAVTALVRKLIPSDSPRVFNQALMEFGALVCVKSPRCGECPLTDFCLAFRRETVGERPGKREKAAYRALEMVSGVIMCKGLVFVRKRPQGGLWPGLWEFPGGPTVPEEKAEQAVVRFGAEAVGVPVTVRNKIATVKHGYTIWRVTLGGFLCDAEDGGERMFREEAERKWVRPDELKKYAFSAGHRKLLELLGWK